LDRGAILLFEGASGLTSLYISGALGIRTPDLFRATEARYQLRQSPLSSFMSPLRATSISIHAFVMNTNSQGAFFVVTLNTRLRQGKRPECTSIRLQHVRATVA